MSLFGTCCCGRSRDSVVRVLEDRIQEKKTDEPSVTDKNSPRLLVGNKR